MNNKFDNIVDDTTKIATLCNEIERDILVESIKNKKLMVVKNNVYQLKNLIIKVLNNIVKSDIVSMEIAILFENGVYLGVIDGKYVIYKKEININEVDILGSSKELKRAIEIFYKYAYDIKKKNYLKKM